MSEVLTPKVITLDDQIDQSLVKENVTEAVLAALEKDYLPLKINGPDDKQGYLEVQTARKNCKKLRVLTKDVCEKGREDAIAIQKKWIAKQKEITDRIEVVESYLEKQEDDYEAEQKRIKEEKKRKLEEQFILRQSKLNSMEALYADGNFILGDVSYEMTLIKECDEDIWSETILPKFKAQFDIIEEVKKKAEQERLEKEAELKRQQEEVERKQRELEERESAIKKAEDERTRKEQQDRDREAAEAKAKRDAKITARCDQLALLGLRFDFSDNHYKGYDCFVPTLDIQCHDDEKWSEIISQLTDHITKKKAQEEEKRLADIEEQKRIAAEDAAKKEREKIAEEQRQADIKKQQEEERKAEELAQGSDKVKWLDMLSQLDAITIHDMKSGSYRKRVAVLKDKLEEIKAL